MIWGQIALFVVSTLISVALAPDPGGDAAAASGISDFNVPTADEGRPIPVLFGTNLVKGANIVWYGHLRSVPVKS